MLIKATQFPITTTSQTYFIADIAANHDGKLGRALKLIELAAESGANAAKFQHFRAGSIISDSGFRTFGKGLAHQKKWPKSVKDVYQEAEVPLSWTDKLRDKCYELGIDFFSAIYDLDLLDKLAPSMPFFKIGSGDITWAEILEKTAKFGKPMFIATGASSLTEVREAVEIVSKHGIAICLMQCNTNYTGDDRNIKYANLRVLNQYRKLFPDVILGLSDHTSSNTTVLGAIALGATVIEKHFTDNRDRTGPDHAFSLDSKMWANMVLQSRELEMALGDGEKKVEDNEREAQVVQRRSGRLIKNVKKGEKIFPNQITFLRPCPKEAATPTQIFKREYIIARESLKSGDFIPSEWLER